MKKRRSQQKQSRKANTGKQQQRKKKRENEQQQKPERMQEKAKENKHRQTTTAKKGTGIMNNNKNQKGSKKKRINEPSKDPSVCSLHVALTRCLSIRPPDWERRGGGGGEGGGASEPTNANQWALKYYKKATNKPKRKEASALKAIRGGTTWGKRICITAQGTAVAQWKPPEREEGGGEEGVVCD